MAHEAMTACADDPMAEFAHCPALREPQLNSSGPAAAWFAPAPAASGNERAPRRVITPRARMSRSWSRPPGQAAEWVRWEMETELCEAVGTAVILGDPGTGKSMLAHHVASLVDHGCGWFLDASSEQALTVALATAEAQATGQPEESIDGPELRRLARAALGRLRKADGP